MTTTPAPGATPEREPASVPYAEAQHTARPATARLERIGRLEWPQARSVLAGTTCAWADLDGFHVAAAEQLPQHTPLSTHLWAWDQGRCLRLRIDGAHALVAALRPGQDDGEQVRVHIRPGTPWAPDDQQAGPLPTEAHALTFELLELPGPTPATFVRATTP
ncbi:hypothetical protein GCM10023084_79620 [Streptomyces lacrimifluminis]|uniref:Uncharacterized protein n=1 Tax=Streptomyces lacrimifluminis TaxID=1500077 RepID=A0A917UNA3_9ACTN|nr:hypothetical protein [Streptomyces lacrimifluminis]GGJ69973.1 hypothetical protein GCM10012282_78530 [Streptomyces lacrimifluminis]